MPIIPIVQLIAHEVRNFTFSDNVKKNEALQVIFAELLYGVPLVVRAARDSNGGRPLYLLVRKITQKSFIEDDYSTVARLVVAPDETVIEKIVVFPGQAYVIDLKVLKVPETIAVYGLFTRARGESWKVMFEKTRKIEITVGTTAIKRGTEVTEVDARGKEPGS